MIKAPYNFVPLPDTIVFPNWANKISIDKPFKDGISGTIDVKYTAQTPVFIGKGRNDTNNYKAANGKYAIPGSSLRGMLRSVIEIISFGKFNNVDNETLSVRDFTSSENFYMKYFRDNDIKGGWLVNENNDWFLYPVNYYRVDDSEIATCCGLKLDLLQKRNDFEKRIEIEDLKGKSKIFFSVKNNKIADLKQQKEQQNGQSKGFIVLTGNPGTGKHIDYIFEEKKSNQRIKLDYKIINHLKTANIPNAANQKRGFFLHDRLYKCKNINYPGIPIFYVQKRNGQPDTMGLSMMYRLMYNNSLYDAIKNSSEENFAPDMDFAECIFGKISNNALRGRVQFEDAVSENAKPDDMVKKILNNPKTSYYPNYIEQDSEQSEYKTLMDNDVRLRGWKRYPVRNETNPASVDKSPERIASKFSPLKTGAEFNGKIHFHNLKKEELGALLWALTWGNDSNLSHSVGMGKPYGYGQIKAEISSLLYHLNNDLEDNEYTEATKEKQKVWIDDFKKYMIEKVSDWESSPQLTELKAMANPDNANRNNWQLSYMKGGNGEEDFVNAKKEKYYLAPYSEDNQSLKLRGNNSKEVSQKQAKVAPDKQSKSDLGIAEKSIQTCLLSKQTEAGAWKVCIKDNQNIKGNISNYKDVPKDKKVGDEINLLVTHVDINNSSFKYISEENKE